MEFVRVFIGYKYTQTNDKKALQLMLERLGAELKKAGHPNFILHRDYLGWKSAHKGKWKQGMQIIKNIWKSDVVLLIVPHGGKSIGMEIENLITKVLGKKKIVMAVAGVDASKFRSNNNTFGEFKSEDELIARVKQVLG